MTLDQWLSAIYQADIRGDRSAEIAKFMTAVVGDPALQKAAVENLKELNALIAARGEQACAYSSKYRIFLREALGT